MLSCEVLFLMDNDDFMPGVKNPLGEQVQNAMLKW